VERALGNGKCDVFALALLSVVLLFAAVVIVTVVVFARWQSSRFAAY